MTYEILTGGLTAVALVAAGSFAGVAWLERKEGRRGLDEFSFAVLCALFASGVGVAFVLALE